MRRVRLVSALIAVISLVYLVLYKLVLIDWMTVHYWLFPSVLQLLVFRPAFCFSSALFVASLFGASSRGERPATGSDFGCGSACGAYRAVCYMFGAACRRGSWCSCARVRANRQLNPSVGNDAAGGADGLYAQGL